VKFSTAVQRRYHHYVTLNNYVYQIQFIYLMPKCKQILCTAVDHELIVSRVCCTNRGDVPTINVRRKDFSIGTLEITIFSTYEGQRTML